MAMPDTPTGPATSSVDHSDDEQPDDTPAIVPEDSPQERQMRRRLSTLLARRDSLMVERLSRAQPEELLQRSSRASDRVSQTRGSCRLSNVSFAGNVDAGMASTILTSVPRRSSRHSDRTALSERSEYPSNPANAPDTSARSSSTDESRTSISRVSFTSDTGAGAASGILASAPAPRRVLNRQHSSSRSLVPSLAPIVDNEEITRVRI